MKSFFIFDIDGTLIDSNDFHSKAWQYAFQIFGRRIPYKKIRSQMGKGGDQLLPGFLERKEVRRFGKPIMEVRAAIFKNRFLPEVKPFPQVRGLFKEIKRRGGRVALASSSKEEEVQRFIKIARIENLVDRITSSDDAQSSKPQPDIVRAALRKLKNPHHTRVLMVGDSPFDAQAARKAGIRMVGVLCGGFTEEILRRSGSVAVFDDPAHLLKELDAVMELLHAKGHR